MTVNELVRYLSEHFGQNRVCIRSQYHIQVVSGKSRPHNVWITGDGQIKWNLAGDRQTTTGNLKRLLEKIGAYADTTSDLDGMREAHRLSSFMVEAKRQAEAGRNTIFCDAGWKGGKAQISIVAILEDGIEAYSRNITIGSSQEAEVEAIKWAVRKFPGFVVYSDCLPAVQNLGNEMVKHIGRENNKAADRIGNMRGNS